MKKFWQLPILALSFLFLTFTLSPAGAQKEAPTLKLGEPLPANLFVELAKAINPAVVNISTKVRPRQQMYGRDPFLDMMEQLYGIRPQRQDQNSAPRPYGLGTGFIIREDGLIVTNNHVIAKADEIDVQIDEKSEKFYHAKVVGSDERTDIALIKIEGKGFPAASLGSSADLQVGEWVAAFGNPFGQGHTMTKGIVSAKGRDLSEINRFPLIQTDAPINPGNSGGPLVNSRGQVIGVNSAIDPRAQGIGFAIPIDEVKALLPQLEKLGRVRKGYMGVQLGELDQDAAAQLGLKDLDGAFVAGVGEGTPADRAGLRAYDVITEFNGKKIHSANELRDTVAGTPIGTQVTMKIIREGKSLALKASVTDTPDKVQFNARPARRAGAQPAPLNLGFTVMDANSQLRQQFQLDEDVNRPIVVDVQNGSPAATAGLLPGDVVLDVNRKDVGKASEVQKLLHKGSNTLRLARNQAVIFLVLNTP